MGQIIRWSIASMDIRTAVCELVGWRNAKGKVTPTGKRIAKTDWQKLSEAARNVLTRHGIVE